MKQLNYYFSYKKSLKNSSYRKILSSFTETSTLINFKTFNQTYIEWQKYLFSIYFNIIEKREVANCVLKDMIHLLYMWRQIKGYPQHGNTTHTNSNTSKKNKLLLNFRINQFYTMFGQKKRNIYPTLVKAEYNNRLWYYNWKIEWLQANIKASKMALFGTKFGSFNPVLLSQGHTNNYTRTGKAAKMSKAKKLTKVFTIGVPLLFSRYIYLAKPPMDFPKIILQDEVNKKLGKKFKRKALKKK